MREIKFRAWDKTRSQYQWGNSNLMINMGGLKMWQFAMNPPEPVEQDDFIIEQFTGLKDKNGKEIYEGDIVEIVEENDSDHGFFIPVGERRVIEWVDDMFCLIVIPNFIGRQEGASICEKCGSWEGLMSENHEISIGCFARVIGNIHENQELLKETGEKNDRP